MGHLTTNSSTEPGGQDERQRAAFGSLLAAVLESRNVDELLQRILAIAAGLAGARFATATTRGGQRLSWSESKPGDMDENALWIALDEELLAASEPSSEQPLGIL